MAGNKNSGRKGRYQINAEQDLSKLCVTFLRDNFANFDGKTQLRVALEIAKKTLTPPPVFNNSVKTYVQVYRPEVYSESELQSRIKSSFETPVGVETAREELR